MQPLLLTAIHRTRQPGNHALSNLSSKCWLRSNQRHQMSRCVNLSRAMRSTWGHRLGSPPLSTNIRTSREARARTQYRRTLQTSKFAQKIEYISQNKMEAYKNNNKPIEHEHIRRTNVIFIRVNVRTNSRRRRPPSRFFLLLKIFTYHR